MSNWLCVGCVLGGRGCVLGVSRVVRLRVEHRENGYVEGKIDGKMEKV